MFINDLMGPVVPEPLTRCPGTGARHDGNEIANAQFVVYQSMQIELGLRVG